jgi:aminopeptidase-like protein
MVPPFWCRNLEDTPDLLFFENQFYRKEFTLTISDKIFYTKTRKKRIKMYTLLCHSGMALASIAGLAVLAASVGGLGVLAASVLRRASRKA